MHWLMFWLSSAILFALANGVKLHEGDQAILDMITKAAKGAIGETKLIPPDMMTQLKALQDDQNTSPDCKNVIEECINRQSIGNCKEDVKDCAEEAFFGAAAIPKYSDMGKDVDLPGIMQEAATELGMSDGTAVAKKLLKQCLSYQRSSILTAFEGLFKKKGEKLSPQDEFLCRALTGKDLGTFPDLLSAPLECPTFADDKISCKESAGRPPITELFQTYYDKVFTSAGKPVEPNLDFRACWTKGDRGLCMTALFIGRMCHSACPVATCTYTQLKHKEECALKLKPTSDSFFTTANSQCEALAKAFGVKGIQPCKNPEPRQAPEKGASTTGLHLLGFIVPFLSLSMFGC